MWGRKQRRKCTCLVQGEDRHFLWAFRETFKLMHVKNKNVTNSRIEIDGETFKPAEKKDGKRKLD